MKDHKITHYNFLPNEKPKKEDYTHKQYDSRKLPEHVAARDFTVNNSVLLIKGDEYPTYQYSYERFLKHIEDGDIISKALDFYNLRENGPEIPWNSFEDELPEVGKEIKRYDGDDGKVHDFIFRYRYSRDNGDKWIDPETYNTLQSEREKVRYLGDENELFKGWELAPNCPENQYVFYKRDISGRIKFEVMFIDDLPYRLRWWDNNDFHNPNEFEIKGIFYRSELQLILNNRMK